MQCKQERVARRNRKRAVGGGRNRRVIVGEEGFRMIVDVTQKRQPNQNWEANQPERGAMEMESRIPSPLLALACGVSRKYQRWYQAVAQKSFEVVH